MDYRIACLAKTYQAEKNHNVVVVFFVSLFIFINFSDTEKLMVTVKYFENINT